jgi:site-specific DNA-methyltransferase (cytosine-N4-specific)
MRNTRNTNDGDNGAYRSAYTTPFGQAIVGDSHDVLKAMPDDSVDLVMTSPPFALLREKDYGNHDQDNYIDWLCGFAPDVRRILKPTGSFVIDLGGAYQRGVPVRSLYQFRVLLRLVDEFKFFLAEEFYWHNPSKLPSPIEWVNKRKLRAKDSVNTVWWMGKTEWPKANVSNVLAPYSARMKILLKDAKKFYTPKDRPSGHDIGEGFNKDNGGAIPANLLQISNSESNGCYLRGCKDHGVKAHSARFPIALPEFFIKFLTDPGDLVLDIFGGSGTTGEAAEGLGRKWKTIDLDPEYVRGSAFRFIGERSPDAIAKVMKDIEAGKNPLLEPVQPMLLGLSP